MPLREFVSKQFLGREKELGALRRIASQASSGDSNSILLFGKRGIGKTELLKHLYNDLFHSQGDTIPFLYSMQRPFSSVAHFSEDYVSSYILQGLAFIKRDPLFINGGSYTLHDLAEIDDDTGWVKQITDRYFHLRESGDPVKLLSFAASVPYHCYRHSGISSVVMIDGFQNITRLPDLNSGDDGRGMWMCFEKSFQFQHAPHIVTGFSSDLHRMFFEETSFGEHFEIMNLSGLQRNDALDLCAALCRKYELEFQDGLKKHIQVFGGTPFYITSFVQTARQDAGSPGQKDFWDMYTREIMKGKIYTYWTSILKTYIRGYEMRRKALNVLYNLIGNSGEDMCATLSEKTSLGREEIDHILELLSGAGTLDTGFSTVEFTDDMVLADVVTGLYRKEILRESAAEINAAIRSDRVVHVVSASKPDFGITIPSERRAELVAVKSLEQIARYYYLPPEITGQLEMSLVEVFSLLIRKDGMPVEGWELTFSLKEKMFHIEIITSVQDIEFSEDERRYVRPYVDEIRVEQTPHGSIIRLVKELRADFTAP